MKYTKLGNSEQYVGRAIRDFAKREMVPFCEEENIAITPYSALASGRLSRKPGE